MCLCSRLSDKGAWTARITLSPVSTTFTASRLRAFLTAYIAVAALITLSFALLNARVAHPWIIGEWLINYTGGFLRRGLLGALLLAAHYLTHLSLVGLTAALQVSLYAAFYASLLPLLRGVRWSLPLLALLLSPATLAFTVLDPPTSVRKEIFLFLALSLLSNAVIRLRPKPWHLAIALSAAAPLLVLLHEALAVFLPYLFVPLLLSTTRLRTALRLLLVPVLLTALALTAVLTHLGGSTEAQAVCTSVGGRLDHRPGGLCNGAIAYLELTPAEARAQTLRAIRFYRYRTRYPLPIVLTLLPIAALFLRRLQHGRRQAKAQGETRLLLALTLLSFVASVPLFVIARDWGRWLEIHATCLLVLFLLLERPDASIQERYNASTDTAGLTLTNGQLLALALYATCWTMPAVGIFPGRFGYLDLARYLKSYRHNPHLTTSAAPPPTPLPPSASAMPCSLAPSDRSRARASSFLTNLRWVQPST